jgi:dienelactone hydrolase
MRVTRVEDLLPGPPRPAWHVGPDSETTAGAVVFHGYGGCKEAMLGLALNLAEVGFACIVPDLPGHGEHPEPLGPALLEEARGAVEQVRRYGPVLAIGHSLGGRLALLSGADAVVAISPALPMQPSPEGIYALRTFASPKVRQDYPGQVVDVLKGLPPHSVADVPVLIVLGEGDIPAIVRAAEELASSLGVAEVLRVQEGMVLEVDEPPPGFSSYLKYWVNHAGMPTNGSVAVGAKAWAGRALLESKTGVH